MSLQKQLTFITVWRYLSPFDQWKHFLIFVCACASISLTGHASRNALSFLSFFHGWEQWVSSLLWASLPLSAAQLQTHGWCKSWTIILNQSLDTFFNGCLQDIIGMDNICIPLGILGQLFSPHSFDFKCCEGSSGQKPAKDELWVWKSLTAVKDPSWSINWAGDAVNLMKNWITAWGLWLLHRINEPQACFSWTATPRTLTHLSSNPSTCWRNYLWLQVACSQMIETIYSIHHIV